MLCLCVQYAPSASRVLKSEVKITHIKTRINNEELKMKKINI